MKTRRDSDRGARGDGEGAGMGERTKRNPRNNKPVDGKGAEQKKS